MNQSDRNNIFPVSFRQAVIGFRSNSKWPQFQIYHSVPGLVTSLGDGGGDRALNPKTAIIHTRHEYTFASSDPSVLTRGQAAAAMSVT